MSSNTQKLAVLRRRTDVELVVLIQRELDRGMASVEVASTRSSPFFTTAMEAHHTASALWAKVAGVGEGERATVEAKLKELRSRLEDVPATTRAYATLAAS